jgi:hypothetical protein
MCVYIYIMCVYIYIYICIYIYIERERENRFCTHISLLNATCHLVALLLHYMFLPHTAIIRCCLCCWNCCTVCQNYVSRVNAIFHSFLPSLLTYLRSWALPEKLPIMQPFRKLPADLRNPKVHHRVHKSPYWSLSWASSIQSTPSHPISLRFILMLSYFLINIIVTCWRSAANNLWVLDHLHRFIGSHWALVTTLSYHNYKIAIAHIQF